MASPAGFEDGQKDSAKKILFRFCSECSNLLFPREDKVNNKLLFACRTCAFTEEAPSSCVMRHEIASSVGDTAGITQDVAQDPTVGISQTLSNTTLSESFPGLCTMCGQDIVCIECGEDSAPGLCFEADDEDPLTGVGEPSSKN
ncbi:hypothetical protein BU24DRAFT_461634 [Aaosphaeria arxii CBS 175.79]|uniref:DNA-directed RNA polymerase II subunit RPB9-like zinc ribbon domain-containing protein n=1 Tax=Aaosphaeria arxii CBS 175.79 TaxID=1450172 RepID=A0A6A5XQ34_9PLEO|nr:uncharacterized protein BU24DRAFT_461634 [Aaosphaeria arxii CBS 175.79]KAF2015385.1 hypothetical protein BU24DRAFT_461634 [Aaosphaeria arxii CBS 175.79]